MPPGPVRRRAPPRRSWRTLEQVLPRTGPCALAPRVDGPGTLLGAPRQRLALPRVCRPAAQLLRPWGMRAAAEPGRGRAGPRAIRRAQLRPRGARALPRRVFGALDAA